MEELHKTEGTELKNSRQPAASEQEDAVQDVTSQPQNLLRLDQDSTMALSSFRDEFLMLDKNVAPEKREAEVVNLLPHFLQVAENLHGEEELASFHAFAGEIAQILVLNIQQKLSNKPAEEARIAVEHFFEWKEEVRSNKGWLLLKSIYILSSVDSFATQAIIESELPDILMKCLYLFAVLPSNPKNQKHGEEAAQSSFQEIFTRIILQLCRQVKCVEEMVETRELQCLIIALTSLWDQCSSSWRHRTSLVLRAVSRARAKNIAAVLKAMDCIKICIQNLFKITDQVSALVLAEVAVSVFSFVKDSYSTNPVLLEEFENNEGYRVLQTILSRCDAAVNHENGKPIEELMDFIAALTICGKAELKVAVCVSNPQPPDFKFDPPISSGSSSIVKNLPAFRILQSTFLQSENPYICTQLLRTIKMIWTWDKANFFLLEWTLQSLSQLAECICLKSQQIHHLFFELVELVVFCLSYIPHETLNKIQCVFKRNLYDIFNIEALECFYKLTLYNPLFSDIFSDSGLLEQLLGELRKQAKILRKAGNKEQGNGADCQKKLTSNMLKVVAALTLTSVKNTVFIRDSGMIPYIKIFLDEQQFRNSTLCILEQLSDINPEEYMSTAIGALCSSTEAELQLKRDLLQSVLKVLETPKGWNAFRTAGGFNGLLSIIVDMEGALNNKRCGVWAAVDHNSIMDLILLTLHTIAVAIHLNPVNGHFFKSTGHYEKMAEAIFQLGCFQEADVVDDSVECTHWRMFHEFVETVQISKVCWPLPLRDCIKLLDCLDQMARGTHVTMDFPDTSVAMADRCDVQLMEQDNRTNTSQSQHMGDHDFIGRIRSAASSVSSVANEYENRSMSDQLIVHPGAVHVIMTLLPKITSQEDKLLSQELRCAVANHVQSLVKSERNRQIVCESGLLKTLLTHCQSILENTEDPIHLPVIRIFEKLASQAIDHKSLRLFLRLGDPLKCGAGKPSHSTLRDDSKAESLVPDGEKIDHTDRNVNQKLKPSFSLLNVSWGSVIPEHRIVSLISMTSPRNFHPNKVSTSPSFVEFDMSGPGYGCLFLPSLATVKGVSADTISTGGVGSECRGFPPSAGLSFSTWFLISRFSSSCDTHPIHLFAIVRHMSRMPLHFICLSISISASDGCLVISTEEEAFQFLDVMEPEVTSALPSSVRFQCSKHLIPGQWHHLAVLISKDLKKTCKVSAYLNGKLMGTGKMRYILPFPGQCISMEPTAVIDVYGIIGTPLLWKQKASLIWRIGPTYLFEEVMSSESIEIIYRLGPKYVGNFQCLSLEGVDLNSELSPCRIITEERISFGINPEMSSVTTVAEIRDSYNEVDSRLIAQEVGITSRDSSTPVYLARNISQHLAGTSRTIGAVLVGQTGVRTFISKCAANSFQSIGGPTVILSLVAMASDDNSLYAAMKVLLSVLSTSPSFEKEMIRIHGYKLLAFLLKMKSPLINNRIFQLVLSIVGTMALGCDSVSVQNLCAFEGILCDFQVWQNAPESLDLAVLNHFVDILKSSRGNPRNAEIMHRLNVMKKLIFLLNEPSVTCEKVRIISTIMKRLLKGFFNTKDVCRLGLYLVYTLLPPNLNENIIFSDIVFDLSAQALSQTPARTIWIRNQLLGMLFDLICSDKALPSKDQEEIFTALGSDWILLFIQGNLHSTSVLLGVKLLTGFLYNRNNLVKFRDGMSPGTLVENMLEKRENLLDNLKSNSWSFERTSSSCLGFDLLQRLLGSHVNIPQIYSLLAALFLQTTGFETPTEKLNLDDVLQSLIDSRSESQDILLCPDVAILLLELVKTILTKPTTGTEDSWEINFPGSIMQFFCLVHNLFTRDPLWHSPDFLHALAGTVFPPASHESFCAPASQDGSVVSEAGALPEGVLPKVAHPARKQVCDFMRILLMDTLINIPAKKHPHPFMLLLEFSTENATQDQKQSFQTEVLVFLMDIVRMTCQEEGQATHVSRDDYKSSKAREDGKIATLVGNVAFFSKKLMEKLYLGMFVVEPEKLLQFITEQIVVVMEKAQSHREKTVSVLYNSLNRAILYFLSRPRQTLPEQTAIVNTLKILQEQWDIILATYNANVNFITCLMHCLIQIKSGSYTDGFGWEAHKKHPKKIWYNFLPNKNLQTYVTPEVLDKFDVKSELFNLVESIWKKLMTERKHTLEDTYKIDLSVKQGNTEGAVSISEVSPLWEETALKAWQQFMDSQKKKLNKIHNKKPNALTTAVRTAQKKFGKDTWCTVEVYLTCMEVHRKACQEMFEAILKNHIQMLHSENNRFTKEWLKTERALLRERGLFGPGEGAFLPEEWTQDTAEGPSRMRKRLRKKATPYTNKVLQFPASIKGLYLKCNPIEEITGVTEDSEADSVPGILCSVGEEVDENGLDCDKLTFFPSLNDSLLSDDFSEQCMETHVILQELREAEEVNMKLSVVIVEAHAIAEGILLFGKADFYICEGFALSKAGDVYCKKHHPTSVRDSFICSMFNKEKSSGSVSCSRYPYEDIKEAHFMRFLLQDNAVEIFMRNGQSRFLVFENKDHVTAFKRLSSAVPSLKGKGVTEAIINVRKNAGGEKSVLHRWQKGEISNFEYLMHLNTLAGRTYNDLMQYPIFPWIIADYDSQELDLSCPNTFRDLSKPMGAQTDKRKDKFIQRYKEVENNDGDLSAQCHYCTHYSSAIIVASFLVRMEPFTQTFLSLQGGSFDVADRMFHCVKKEWVSASQDNMSDVRELIPEFFYLPDFLVNSNDFELGRMQDGTSLGDVVLPPWAKGDPVEFIRLQREALESEYVSANLHLWIDLIFGFKQQGPSAVEAVNTFHPYFYAERLDADSMKDPLKKSTILGFVSNFGQIPKQLFTKPHPPRAGHQKSTAPKEAPGSTQTQPFFVSLDKLKPSVQPLKELIRGPVGHIVCGEREVMAVEKNKLLIPPLWNTYFSWGFHDNTCAFGSYALEKNFAISESLSDWGGCLCAACPNQTTIVTAGSSTVVCVWDVSIGKEKLKHFQLKQTLYGHNDAVTCLAVSVPYSVIVSGSLDKTCIIWDLDRLNYITQLPEHSAGLSAVAINDLTGEIASCAGTHLYLWNMKGHLLADINTSCGHEDDILCCCFAQKNEWDSRSVIVTGCADGIVRLWKTEYVKTQLPAHQVQHLSLGHTSSSALEKSGKEWEKHLVLCRELNRSQAVSRKRYKNNPAVTALGISRTHNTLLVGDAWGRVYSWSIEV
ncbi:WD repeat- and FYVE domain-containing protein 4 [Amia ocellicauda]|uniref:WD repeat- and FYVE domain-containing protein 4 n=1 Tax=Amia ocellicauda TaxID=2972642 RepID=UPI00346483A9